MKASDLVAPVIEPLEGRYDREWFNLNDDRKVRGFDYKDEARREREYVDPDAGETVSAVGDNNPTGFDRAAFEDTLVYNPSMASGATAGSPGDFSPEGSHAPYDLAGLSGVTADPETAWTTGQHVVLGDGSQAHWNGTAWTAGAAA